MGFKASPYNLVHMYLVAKEVIRGNRNNYTNVFQWSNLMLNLPGTRGYNPLRAWITKMGPDNSLASDFVCFVDNQRIAGHRSRKVREAGHAISTRESYLVLQDALRKVQAPEGSRTPGAWAGATCAWRKGWAWSSSRHRRSRIT
jgi:hypothetical protein